MKKILTVFLSAFAVCMSFNADFSANAAYSLGDVNGSGSIDSSDASMILQEYSSISTYGISHFSNAQKQAADVNKSGNIDSSDASDVLNYYAYTSTGGDMLIDYYLAEKTSDNPSDNPDTSNEQEEKLKALALEMGREINKERVAAGLQPLKITPYLMEISDIRAKEIVGTFSHYRPDGSDCFSILDDVKVPYYHAGEDIAAGASTVSGTLEQWRSSTQGHWQEIMLPQNTHMGIGVAYSENSTYRWYWETFFVQAAHPLDGEYIP